jgi:hypothetical protein
MSYHSAGLNPIVDGTNVTGSWMEYVEDSIDDIEATLAENIPANVYDYKIIKTSSYYEAYDAYGDLKYGGSANTGGVTGTDFSAVINKCLQSISALGGGTVFLDADEFTAESQIVIPATLTPNAGQERCIQIVGAGGTVIKVDEDLAAHAIYLDSSTVYHMVRLVGFDVWHHNKDENYYSIYIKDARQVLIEDVIVGWGGMYIKDCAVIYISNFQAVDCPNEGLRMENCNYV